MPVGSSFVIPSACPRSTLAVGYLKSRTPPSFIDHADAQIELRMARDDEGPGLVTTVVGILFVILFVGSSLLPFLGGGDRDLSIADSVVTTQDVPGKLANYESKADRLSRSTIQEKLNSIPVFYLVDENGSMKTDLYLSYQDAQDAAGANTVKATTLDQVMYPLVLKRGRMRMAPPPTEVQRAEEEINPEEGSSNKAYTLIPSKAAKADAAKFNLNLVEGNLPLFVTDRLAFAGPRGPQLPLFLEEADCVTSYERLRQGNSRLPEKPNVRTTTLLDELYSMEKGTRPGVSQLAFYATAEDLLKAADLMQN